MTDQDKPTDAERAYVVMLQVSAFLRGYGEAAEIAATKLAHSVPESFEDREDFVHEYLDLEQKNAR